MAHYFIGLNFNLSKQMLINLLLLHRENDYLFNNCFPNNYDARYYSKLYSDMHKELVALEFIDYTFNRLFDFLMYLYAFFRISERDNISSRNPQDRPSRKNSNDVKSGVCEGHRLTTPSLLLIIKTGTCVNFSRNVEL